MFLQELFASIRARRRRSRQRTDEKGAEISRRLQELNGVIKLKPVEKPPSTKAPIESDLDHAYRDKTGT
jgi:hypothetical protein